MGHFSDSANGVVARPVPLFASSWIALFRAIRNRLGNTRGGEGPSQGPGAGGTSPTQH